MLSVIIPTLNAERDLAATLEALVPAAVAGMVSDVVVVDGGSNDATKMIADNAGCNWVDGPKGRGQQLMDGAKHARGSWLLFLHADTVLADNWMEDIRLFVAGTETRNIDQAAVFRFALASRRGKARLLEGLVGLRYRLFSLPYGDQGLLISRAFYGEIGGYKNLAIMEDVEIVRRIGRRRLVRLPSRAITSANRYEREGYLRRSIRNLICLAQYFLGVPAKNIVRRYG